MKKSKKVKITLLAIVSILLLFMTMKYTFASLTDSDEVQNEFKMTNFKGSISEDFKEPTADSPIKVNETYSKAPKVTNQEEVRMFVRVMILPKALSKENVLLPSEIGKDIVINLNSEWIDGEDGYYYYKKILGPTESTDKIFTSITLTNKEYVEAKISVEIKAETIAAYSDLYKEAFWNGTPNSESLKKISQLYEAMLLNIKKQF